MKKKLLLLALSCASLAAMAQTRVDSNGVVKNMNVPKIDNQTQTEKNANPNVQSTVTTGTGGTANYIPRFTTSTNIENTVLPLYENTTGLGIATTSPGFRLDVQGGSTRVQDGNSLYVGGQTDAGNDGFRFAHPSQSGYIDLKGTGDMNFRINNSNGGTLKMILTNAGKLGIGTSTPSGQLDVLA